MADYNNIVIDNGTYILKAGMADENTPSVKFPTIVGTPKYASMGRNQKDE
jgi:actin-related protein